MKLAVYKTTGGQNTPHDVKDLRKKNEEFHRDKGQPVIHKHRWNERDVQEGRALRCPFHDKDFGQDRQWDPYCFGTGYLGGFDDGRITFVTIADSVQDVVRFTAQGIIMQSKTPGMTAPWYPEMGDGDLIITAQFAPNVWDVIDTFDRYELQEVTPVTLRGFGARTQARGRQGEYKVAQSAQIDRLPPNHQFYNVPITFDYSVVPDPNPIYDPSDYPAGTKFSSISAGIRIRGLEVETKHASVEAAIRLRVAGSTSSATSGIVIVGATKGTHVYL